MGVRVWMKVVSDTVMTDSISVKEGKIVDVKKGPMKDEGVDVERVFVTCMADEQEGWISVKGNQGSVFLAEGGNQFKVKAATILTEDFGLEGGSADATKK